MANSENPYQLLRRVAYDVEQLKAWFEGLQQKEESPVPVVSYVLYPEGPGEWRRIVGERSLGLSEREIEVCSRWLSDHSVAEIAADLFIGQDTVRTHLRNVCEKWGLDNRSQIRRFVIKHWSKGKQVDK